MTTFNIILSATNLITLVLLIFYHQKYEKFSVKDKELKEKEDYLIKQKKLLDDVLKCKTRNGYYKYGLVTKRESDSTYKQISFDAIVEVKELERYKNGKSRVEIVKITCPNLPQAHLLMMLKNILKIILLIYVTLKTLNG